MWGFPYLTWVALAGVAGVLVLMAMDGDTRVQVIFTGGLTVALAVTGYVMQRRAAATAAPRATEAAEAAEAAEA